MTIRVRNLVLKEKNLSDMFASLASGKTGGKEEKAQRTEKGVLFPTAGKAFDFMSINQNHS